MSMEKKNKKASNSTLVSVRLQNETVNALDAEAKMRGIKRSQVIKEKILQKKSTDVHGLAYATKRAASEFTHLSALCEKLGTKIDIATVMEDAKSALTYVLGRYDVLFGRPPIKNYTFSHPEKQRTMIKATLTANADETTDKQGLKITVAKVATANGALTVVSRTSTPLEFLTAGTKVCMMGYMWKESTYYADFILIVEDIEKN